MKLLDELPPVTKTGWPWDIEVNKNIYEKNKFEWPKISIVTPSFNQGKFIEETIRSILLQNYPNVQFIIIDGGSTDETLEIINKYSKWIDFWISEKDKGQSDAIHKGFNKATGKILNWINSDDILCKDGLFHIGLEFISNPKLNFVHGKNGIMDIDSKVYSFMPHPKDNLSVRYLYEMPYGQQACFFTKNLYQKSGGVNPELTFSIDYELYLRMHSSGSITSQIDHCIGNIRIHNESKTSNLQKIMHYENGNAFLTFLLSMGYLNMADVLVKMGHKPYNLYKVEQIKKDKVVKAFELYLKKFIWYYYNSNQLQKCKLMALKIFQISPLSIFNLNYLKILKDSIMNKSKTL